MTSNQINYWKNVETERANKAEEDLKRKNLTETQRSNLVNEFVNKENAKSNTQNAQTNRSNMLVNKRNSLTNFYNALTSRKRVDKQNENDDTNTFVNVWDKFVLGPVGGLLGGLLK